MIDERNEDDDEPAYQDRRRLMRDKQELERQAKRAALLEGYVTGREDAESNWLETMLDSKVFRDAYIGALHTRIWELELNAVPTRQGEAE